MSLGVAGVMGGLQSLTCEKSIGALIVANEVAEQFRNDGWIANIEDNEGDPLAIAKLAQLFSFLSLQSSKSFDAQLTSDPFVVVFTPLSEDLWIDEQINNIGESLDLLI